MASKATTATAAPKKFTEKPGKSEKLGKSEKPGKSEKLGKPEKPDEAIFKETKETLGKELQGVQDKLVSLKNSLPKRHLLCI